MLIQEMHNKIELRLQKMASHAYDWIQSPQVDSYINDTILSFTKNRFNSFSESNKAPFQKNIKSMEDLKTLVVPGYSLRPYLVDDGEFFEVELPGDYMFLIEATSLTADKCKYLTGFPTPTSYNSSASRIAIPYNLNSFNVQGTSILEIPDGDILTEPTAGFITHNLLQNVLNNEVGDLYFINGNEYLFVRKQGVSLTPINVTFGLGDTFGALEFLWSDTARTYYPTDDKFSRVRVRVMEQEEFTGYFDHPFAKSVSHSPSGFEYSRFLKIHTGKRFILSNVGVTYIRKPTLVNLSLNVSCDLPEHTHPEIVDRVVLDILETIESQRTQSKSVINQLND